MARRAQQSSVARCPYCEASLPQVAVECPECRFPLTMAAADCGFRAPDHSGTTSTATAGGRSASPVRPTGHPGAHRTGAHASQGHRMRILALLLGVTSILLLLAGVGALFTATSPDASGDREAKTSLVTSLRRATTDPTSRQEVTITSMAAGDPSTAPREVSVDEADGSWFAASRSTSGRCFLLAGRLADGIPFGEGTLGKDEPCTGAQVRLRYEEAQRKSKP